MAFPVIRGVHFTETYSTIPQIDIITMEEGGEGGGGGGGHPIVCVCVVGVAVGGRRAPVYMDM